MDVATFLLNEKRAEITKLEHRYRVSIILIPNTFLETPHYHIERIRADDERLDDDIASYKRAEELTAVADDPYAIKKAEEKPEHAKQIPVIKSILPKDVAPKHEEKPEVKAEDTGFFTKILSFFGIGAEKKEEEPKKKPRNKREPRARRNARNAREDRLERNERRRNRDERREKPVKEAQAKPAEAPKAVKAPQTEAKEVDRRQRRTRRTRRNAEVASEKAVAENTVQASEVKETKVEVSQIPATVEVKAAPQVKDVAPVEPVTTEEQTQESVIDIDEVNKELDLARFDAKSAKKPVRAKKAPEATETESEEASSDAPEADTEPVIESESRRRRPRRRRPTKGASPVATDEAKETPVSEKAPAALSVEATANEPVTEEVKPEVKVKAPEAPEVKEPAVHHEKSIADGLEENLKKAGLTQVGTTPGLATAPSYEPVKYAGRPRPKLEPISEEPLIQVQTKKEA